MGQRQDSIVRKKRVWRNQIDIQLQVARKPIIEASSTIQKHEVKVCNFTKYIKLTVNSLSLSIWSLWSDYFQQPIIEIIEEDIDVSQNATSLLKKIFSNLSKQLRGITEEWI